MLALPATPEHFIKGAVEPALARLPLRMDSANAKVILAAIALQESALAHRWQVIDRERPEVKGPARGLLQFEVGTAASRGGVTGVLMHPASGGHLRDFCARRGTKATPRDIHAEIETDDVLTSALGRLLMWTDALALPAMGDEAGAWNLYARTWRPGKPHPERWPANYQRALRAI